MNKYVKTIHPSIHGGIPHGGITPGDDDDGCDGRISQPAQTQIPTHPGTKYPVRGNPSLWSHKWARKGLVLLSFRKPSGNLPVSGFCAFWFPQRLRYGNPFLPSLNDKACNAGIALFQDPLSTRPLVFIIIVVVAVIPPTLTSYILLYYYIILMIGKDH